MSVRCRTHALHLTTHREHLAAPAQLGSRKRSRVPGRLLAQGFKPTLSDRNAPAVALAAGSHLLVNIKADYHIKGTCAAGEFVGRMDAPALSRSALYSGKTIPVLARFSLGGGSPEVPDAAPAPRGMALEFHLPDGALQHITMINAPIFAAASPASFRDLLLAAKPDPKTGQPDPEKLKTYAADHPDSMALTELASHHTPTANYSARRIANRDRDKPLLRRRSRRFASGSNTRGRNLPISDASFSRHWS